MHSSGDSFPRPGDDQIEVVLVDESGDAVGTAPKLRVHQEGLLHRAVSVFVFNSRGELLLQRRAAGKYHSPGLWTNTACSHPHPGEDRVDAARRALREEMGIDCALRRAFTFTYRAVVGEQLVEHEYDDVFVGVADAEPAPVESEVAEWRWVALAQVERELAVDPGRFTRWFPLALRELRAWSGESPPGTLPPGSTR